MNSRDVEGTQAPTHGQEGRYADERLCPGKGRMPMSGRAPKGTQADEWPCLRRDVRR